MGNVTNKFETALYKQFQNLQYKNDLIQYRS